MMDLKQRIQVIDSLLPILFNYMESGQAKIQLEQQEMLRDIYWEVFQQNIAVDCQSCIIQGLHMLMAYKESVSGQFVERTEKIIQSAKQEKVGGCTGCKNKK